MTKKKKGLSDEVKGFLCLVTSCLTIIGILTLLISFGARKTNYGAKKFWDHIITAIPWTEWRDGNWKNSFIPNADEKSKKQNEKFQELAKDPNKNFDEMIKTATRTGRVCNIYYWKALNLLNKATSGKIKITEDNKFTLKNCSLVNKQMLGEAYEWSDKALKCSREAEDYMMEDPLNTARWKNVSDDVHYKAYSTKDKIEQMLEVEIDDFDDNGFRIKNKR